MKSLEEQVKIIQKVMHPDYDSGKKPPEWVGKQLFDEVIFTLKLFKAEYRDLDDEIDQEARLVIAEYLEKRPEHIKNTVAYLVTSVEKSWKIS